MGVGASRGAFVQKLITEHLKVVKNGVKYGSFLCVQIHSYVILTWANRSEWTHGDTSFHHFHVTKATSFLDGFVALLLILHSCRYAWFTHYLTNSGLHIPSTKWASDLFICAMYRLTILVCNKRSIQLYTGTGWPKTSRTSHYLGGSNILLGQ